MTIRLYCDEDSMQHALVLALRKRGVDVLTALEAENTEETDERQLAFAAAQGRAIYSFNVGDFCRLHSQWLARAEVTRGDCLGPAAAVLPSRANQKARETCWHPIGGGNAQSTRVSRRLGLEIARVPLLRTRELCVCHGLAARAGDLERRGD